MAIRYQWSADYQGRHLLAVFLTNGFVGNRTFLLPHSSAGFSCNSCVGFHFNRERYDMVQYNDAVSQGGLSFAFAPNTFSQLGTHRSMDVGSGVSELLITEE